MTPAELERRVLNIERKLRDLQYRIESLERK